MRVGGHFDELIPNTITILFSKNSEVQKGHDEPLHVP